MQIHAIDVIPLNMRLHPAIEPHLYRSGARARSPVLLYRVQLANGAIGYGEDMGDLDDVSKYVGYDALQGLRAIPHAGVQMACYDAVGRALEVPAHVLMGKQVRQRVPLAYWSIDLPPETFAAQAAEAAAQGYRVYKYKSRPWWDPIEQVEAAAKLVPSGFKVWLDFNGHLREARLALPILQELERFDCVGGFESPIPQRDAAGYAELRRKLSRPIAAHYGSGCCHVASDPGYDRGVPALQQISERLCDGFVLGGSDVETLRQQAAVAAAGNLPFWIQVVGTGLRAAWVAHVASTCRQGTLSHLAAHNIWQDELVQLPPLVAGWLPAPTGPGLGIEVDPAQVEALRDAAPLGEEPRRISTVVYPDGVRYHFAGERQRHEAFYFGDLPGFVRGVRLDIWVDDDSTDFADLYARSAQAPVVSNT
jgi:L-alanine-DL-glutamate epimerase-like enolase superfamily enzyme